MIYRVSARTDGASEPSVSVDWDSNTEAVESFVELVKSVGGELNERAFKILLNMFISNHYRKDFFQIFAADERTVVTIQAVHIPTVGIPTH
jgi:hypothetical protein